VFGRANVCLNFTTLLFKRELCCALGVRCKKKNSSFHAGWTWLIWRGVGVMPSQEQEPAEFVSRRNKREVGANIEAYRWA
jgi:outer membrane scaffolding protein for murein synthesis (MipA/OmpV family)